MLCMYVCTRIRILGLQYKRNYSQHTHCSSVNYGVLKQATILVHSCSFLRSDTIFLLSAL